MDDFDKEEITEYLPDDPLAEVSEVIPKNDYATKCNLIKNHSFNIINHPRKYSKRKGISRINKVTKVKPNLNITCTVCALPFLNRSLLKLHQKAQHQKQFECFVCHKSFSRKSNLITHSRSHTNVKPFCCNYCSLSFIRSTELLKHVIFHTGDTRNQCKECKVVLSSQERLEKHKKLHTVIANFQCHMCGADGFQSKKSLSSHMRLHAKVSDKIRSNSGLTGVDKVEQIFECEICKKRFTRKSNFVAHVKRHDRREVKMDKVKTHLCFICGKLFSYKTHLIRHLYIHEGNRPYKCEYCGSDFTHRGGLMKHIKIHKRDS